MTISRKAIAALALLVTTFASPALAAEGVPPPQSSEVSKAMDFLNAVGRLDFDNAGALLDEKAVLELPYVGDGLTVSGKADILAFFRRSMSTSVAGIVYTLQRAYPDPKGGWTVLEISTRGRTASGHDYTNRLVGIFVYRSGRIVLFREYFNPAKIG